MMNIIISIICNIISAFFKDQIDKKITSHDIEQLIRQEELDALSTPEEKIHNLLLLCLKNANSLGYLIKEIDVNDLAKKLSLLMYRWLIGKDRLVTEEQINEIITSKNSKWSIQAKKAFFANIQHFSSHSNEIIAWLETKRFEELKTDHAEQNKVLKEINEKLSNNGKLKEYDHSTVLNDYMNLVTDESSYDKWPVVSVDSLYEFNIKNLAQNTEFPRKELIDQFLKYIESSKWKICLVGSAGIGKSNVFLEILRTIVKRDYNLIPVVFDLSRVSNSLDESSPDHIINKLIDETTVISSWGGLQHVFEYARSSHKPVILLCDALNEIGDNKKRAHVVKTLSHFLLDFSHKLLVFSDRSHSHECINFEIQRVPPECVKKIYNQRFPDKYATLHEPIKKVLSISYFLNWFASREGVGKYNEIDISAINFESFSTAFTTYFNSHIKLSEENINILSSVAYMAYKNFRSTLFDSSIFASCKAEIIKQTLEELKEIISYDGHYKFEHQLKHDFLASYYLIRHEDQWNHECFNNVSLDQGNTDLFKMAIEQVSNAENGDKFLERLYDWNWQISLNCLCHSFRMNYEKIISKDMAYALTAIIAMKQFDRFLNTSIYVKKMAERCPRDKGLENIIFAKSIEDIFSVISQHQEKNEWFYILKTLFSKVKNKQEFTESDIDYIIANHSILGWGCANLIKCNENLHQQASLQLRSFCKATHGVNRRWRTVHALGALPSDENIEFLLTVLRNDPDSTYWVKYGAGRSLIEIAYKNATKRSAIFHELKKAVENNNKLSSRLSKDFHIIDPPPNWNEESIDVLNAFKAKLDGMERGFIDHQIEILKRG